VRLAFLVARLPVPRGERDTSQDSRPSLGALSVAEEILSTPISWMK